MVLKRKEYCKIMGKSGIVVPDFFEINEKACFLNKRCKRYT